MLTVLLFSLPIAGSQDSRDSSSYGGSTQNSQDAYGSSPASSAPSSAPGGYPGAPQPGQGPAGAPFNSYPPNSSAPAPGGPPASGDNRPPHSGKEIVSIQNCLSCKYVRALLFFPRVVKTCEVIQYLGTYIAHCF